MWIDTVISVRTSGTTVDTYDFTGAQSRGQTESLSDPVMSRSGPWVGH